MEQFVEMTGGWFKHTERKLLRIKNFEISIIKIKTPERTEEAHMHIKNIKVEYLFNSEILLTRTDTKEKYQMKFLNDDEASNLLNVLSKEKASYEAFIKEFYTTNNIYSLIEGDSIVSYFDKISAFIEQLSKSLPELAIDPNLEEILSIQNNYLKKIAKYSRMLNANFKQLNRKNPEEKKLSDQTKQMKEMLNELKDLVTSCTFNTTSDGLESYIANFKTVMKQKSLEILLLIDEIKYNLCNYLALKGDKGVVGEFSNDKEDEITRLKLENDNLKIQIDNIDKENEIITKFIKECKERIKQKKEDSNVNTQLDENNNNEEDK